MVQVDVVCDGMIASGLTVMKNTNTVDAPVQLLEKLTVQTAVAGTADVMVSVLLAMLWPNLMLPPPRPVPSIRAAPSM